MLALANNFLYAVNEKDATISGYSIDSVSGALAPVPDSPLFSYSAVTLAADTSGRYLYVSYLQGVRSYRIDATTGALAPAAGSLLGIDGSLWLTIVQMPSISGAQQERPRTSRLRADAAAVLRIE